MRSEQAHRWQRRKEERPSEIIDAALEVFVEHGYAASKLDDIASKAGVSKGSLYRYFDSKADLFKEMVMQVVIPELEKAESAVNEYQGAMAPLIKRMIENWWQTIGETRICGIPKLVISEAANFPELAEFYVTNVIKRGRKLVAGMISRGVESGEFRQVDPEYAARIMISPIMFAAIWKESLSSYDDDYDIKQFLAMKTEIFLRGISRKEEPDA